MITSSRPSKGYYSESEAAHALGLTLEGLRVLVRRHILQNDDEVHNLPITSFQPSDLLLLRLILARGEQPVAQVSQ